MLLCLLLLMVWWCFSFASFFWRTIVDYLILEPSLICYLLFHNSTLLFIQIKHFRDGFWSIFHCKFLLQISILGWTGQEGILSSLDMLFLLRLKTSTGWLLMINYWWLRIYWKGTINYPLIIFSTMLEENGVHLFSRYHYTRGLLKFFKSRLPIKGLPGSVSSTWKSCRNSRIQRSLSRVKIDDYGLNTNISIFVFIFLVNMIMFIDIKCIHILIGY